MKLSTYSQNGKKSTKQAEVSDAVFGAKVNKSLLSQYVYTYLSNQREVIADTKGKGEVSGGGKKPHAQKGTGRARAGSNRSPLWRKGGITFGPNTDVNFKKKMNTKMRKQAICSALSMLAAEDKVKVVDAVKLENSKLTKQAVDMIAAFGNPRKLTIVVDAVNAELQKAFANVPAAKVKLVSELNAYDVLNGGEIVFLESALEYTNRWDVKSDTEVEQEQA